MGTAEVLKSLREHTASSYFREVDAAIAEFEQLQAENKRKDKALDIAFKRLDTGGHSYHKHFHGGCALCEIEQTLKEGQGSG